MVIKYKGEKVDSFFTRDELLNGILKGTNPQQTINYLIKLVKVKFKVNEISYKNFFANLENINIINEKTNTSFQLNRVKNLMSGDKSDHQIMVGQKKGLEGISLIDITDKVNSDKTKNGIIDNRLQAALNAFKEVVKQDTE